MAAVTIKRLSELSPADSGRCSPLSHAAAPGGPSPSSVMSPLRPRSQNNKCSPPEKPHQQLTPEWIERARDEPPPPEPFPVDQSATAAADPDSDASSDFFAELSSSSFKGGGQQQLATAAWDRRPPSAIEARIGAAFSMTGAALQPKSLSATASIATTPSSSATPPPEAEQPFRPTREIFFGRPATFFSGYPVRPRGRTWAPLR